MIVVGAGPAGLFFSIAARLLRPDAPLRIVDKRASYVRTHRLRMDPEPYLEWQEDLRDPRFDSIIDLLREHDFTPEINVLEEKLARTLADLGVEKEVLEVTSIDALDTDVIVAADSVHSAVRESVRGNVSPIVQTHEQVARLRVSGKELPKHLGLADKLRLAKVLGSLVDYRWNRNGFAEVDLFLTQAEHAEVGSLGANPKNPVRVTTQMLGKMRAPFFRAIVEQLERVHHSEVTLHSTFRLEHLVMPKLAFEAKGKRIFLVGDAGIALPFFRGMACLARCGRVLARMHAEGDMSIARYDEAAREIRERELSIVRARGRLLRAAREVARVSALMPFPIQSWLLAAPDLDTRESAFTIGLFFNLVLAIAAGALAFTPWPYLAIPVQIVGGAAFHTAITLEPGPHRWVRRIWQLQIAALFFIGVGLTASRGLSNVTIALWWLVLAIAFVVGLYGFEFVYARTVARALPTKKN